jgi:zinc/manganese transport system permease protein
MIGAPAAARSFTDRPLPAMALSVAIALITVWTAIAASYETNYPVGFYVGGLSAVSYAAGRAYAAWRRRRVATAARREGGASPTPPASLTPPAGPTPPAGSTPPAGPTLPSTIVT